MIAFDTETFLIAPRNVAPRVVCASFTDGESIEGVLGNGDAALLPQVEALFNHHEIVGHSVWFDLACCCSTWPHLFPLVFKALDEGRVHDTLIREQLVNLGTHGSIETLHGQKISYSLASIAYRRVGLDLSAGKQGDDVWRLRYAELDGLKAADYPKEAYDYAALDAQATYEVWADQEREHSHFFKPETHHVKAMFCLYLMTAWGLEVDQAAKARAEEWVRSELSPEKLPLLYSTGIVRAAQPARPQARGAKAHAESCSRKKGCECPPKLTKPQPERVQKKAALVPLVEQVCAQHGIPLKLTDKGQTAVDKEWLAELAPLHPALGQFHTRALLDKLRTAYFPALEWPFGSGETCEIVHPNYRPLKETGRASSYGVTKKSKNPLYPAVNIQQADPRIRDVYKPRDGHVFVICDFNAIDLCSCAQTIYDLYGHSTLRDQINRGLDPHCFMGAVLAYDGDPVFHDLASKVKGDDDAVYQLFVEQKKSDRLCACPPGHKHKPGWFEHWRHMAKPWGLSLPGGAGLATLIGISQGYGFRVDLAQARRIKELWFGVYPEMRRYLGSWVDQQGGTYESPLGMIRAGCNYTKLANGRALQTPAAEGMKEAMYRVTKACYGGYGDDLLLGCKPVINMHDELVVEVPEDPWIHDRAMRVSGLMIEGMSMILPDVTIRAEPLVARRWTKDAKPVFDGRGRLTVWEPKQPRSAA